MDLSSAALESVEQSAKISRASETSLEASVSEAAIGKARGSLPMRQLKLKASGPYSIYAMFGSVHQRKLVESHQTNKLERVKSVWKH